MRVSKHFIQGFLAPFDFIGALFRMRTRNDTASGSEPPVSGFERDAKNLASDWIKVGNYINNAMPPHEQCAERIRGYWTNLGNYMTDVANGKGQKPSDD